MEKIQVNMHEAKSKLSELGAKAWQGKKIVIAKSGKPYLDLCPHKDTRKPRKPGRLKGQIRMSKDFDQTPESIVKAFEGDM